MHRLVTLTSVLLIVAAWPCARVLAEEEPRPTIDAAHVGRLLLSPEPETRAEGERLLLRRIRQGGDLTSFLHEMASAQESWARSDQHLLEVWIHEALHGTDAERERAQRLIAALGPPAVERLLASLRSRMQDRRPGPDAAAPPSAPAPASGPPPGAPVGADPEAAAEPATTAASSEAEANGARGGADAYGPACGGEVVIVEVASADAQPFLASLSEAAGISRGGDGAPRLLLGTYDEAVTWGRTATKLPDATTTERVEVAFVGGSEQTLRAPRTLRYRRALKRSADGAWEVVPGTIPTGYELGVRVDAVGEGLHVVLRLTHSQAPPSLTVTRVQPEPGVEPIELDNPEWRRASVTTEAELEGRSGGLLVLASGLAPDEERTTIVVLSLRCP
ncbi:MAG: hypothetical protein ACYTG6_07850 [Planctomycetota bacterium]|jgi:hypothetical protein